MYKISEQTIHRIQAGNKRMKRYSTSPVTGKMNMKTPMRGKCQILVKIWGREHIHLLLVGEEIHEDFFKWQHGSCEHKYNLGSAIPLLSISPDQTAAHGHSVDKNTHSRLVGNTCCIPPKYPAKVE